MAVDEQAMTEVVAGLARCSQNVAALDRSGIRLASLDALPLAKGDSPSRAVISFVGHASYQIDTPQGVRAITDYNGFNGFGRKPDIVTMNNAHSTHFTDDPEDGIAYALRGRDGRCTDSCTESYGKSADCVIYEASYFAM